MVKRPRNSQTLPLPAGNSDTSVTYCRLQTLRQFLHKALKLRLLQNLPDTLIVDLIRVDAEGNIVPDGLVDQVDGLGNVADLGKPGRVVFKNIPAVAGDGSRLHMQKPQQNIHNRRFARPRRTHNAHRLSFSDFHMGVRENGLIGVRVGKADMIQHNLIRQRKLRQFLFRLSRKPRHAAVHILLHILRQILVQIVQAGLRVSDLRQIGVYPVRRRHHAHRRRRKRHKLGHQHGDIAVLQHIYENKRQHCRDKNCLDQKSRRII